MSAPKRKRVVFLYLNGLHHIYHTVFSAYELSLLAPELDVQMLSSCAEHTNVLAEIGELYPGHRVRIKTLSRSLKYRFFNYRGRSYPSPWSTKHRAIANLRGAGGVVATSHVAPDFYAHRSATKPKYIYQFHGCGDRRYSFEPALAQFDYLLLPGEYYRERLTEEGIIGNNDWAVVGYPKFDFPGMTDREGGSIFFPGERPTVLYAPHWEPKMSSLEAMGRKVLDYFFRSDRYNLIFAPHVLVKHWNYRHKLDLNFEA